MDFIYIGDIVNTHGIKGEVKILSHFKYKDLVFVKGTFLYVGYSYQKLVINSYRKHQVFDMVTFEGINNINDVLKYKGVPVYIDKNSISVPYFNEELIDMSVYGNNTFIGKVTDILNNGVYDILVISSDGVKNMIPNIDEFILNIDIVNKRIDVNLIDGLLNEN